MDVEERTESKNIKKRIRKRRGWCLYTEKEEALQALPSSFPVAAASHRQLSNHAPSFQVIFSLSLSLIICSHLHAEREQFMFCSK